jgi:hypothetical protein
MLDDCRYRSSSEREAALYLEMPGNSAADGLLRLSGGLRQTRC